MFSLGKISRSKLFLEVRSVSFFFAFQLFKTSEDVQFDIVCPRSRSTFLYSGSLLKNGQVSLDIHYMTQNSILILSYFFQKELSRKSPVRKPVRAERGIAFREENRIQNISRQVSCF